ncbi:MAG: hypothetical protein ACLFMR_07640, partial [Desulfohalobiaceae bacterium]
MVDNYFLPKAYKLLHSIQELNVCFLCQDSLDKTTLDPDQIFLLLQEQTSSPAFTEQTQSLDSLLADPRASLDQILGLIRPATESAEQIYGEIPLLHALQTPVQEEDSPQIRILLDMILAVRLNSLLEERDQNPGLYLAQIRDILSYTSQRRPEFLLLAEPLLRIVADQSLSIIERGRASRTLVNNYNIEQILIYAALNPDFAESERQHIFSWVSAYQKLYRRLESVIYDQKEEKVTVARQWFSTTLSSLRNTGRAPSGTQGLSGFLQSYLQAVMQEQQNRALDLGRALVLSINNEDIIRGLHNLLLRHGALQPKSDQQQQIFSLLFRIMQDYRLICIQKKKAQRQIKGDFARISHVRRDMERVLNGDYTPRLATPVLGSRQEHPLLQETRANLEVYSLLHMFEIWPLPQISQRLFNEVCELKSMIPKDAKHSLGFVLYMEKFLEFLMRLDRLGIQVVQHQDLDCLLTNAYQLQLLHLLQAGMYLGSTGYWRSAIQKPPAVICFTNPGALPNCLQQPMRHIIFRIFLETGQFYESPFILDSTERYGTMDEQGGPEQLFMRPGLFLLHIPARTREHWRRVQSQQQQSPHFQALLQNRIRKG